MLPSVTSLCALACLLLSVCQLHTPQHEAGEGDALHRSACSLLAWAPQFSTLLKTIHVSKTFSHARYLRRARVRPSSGSLGFGPLAVLHVVGAHAGACLLQGSHASVVNLYNGTFSVQAAECALTPADAAVANAILASNAPSPARADFTQARPGHTPVHLLAGTFSHCSPLRTCIKAAAAAPPRHACSRTYVQSVLFSRSSRIRSPHVWLRSPCTPACVPCFHVSCVRACRLPCLALPCRRTSRLMA